MVFVVVFCGFLYSSCWLLTICYRRFLRTQHPEEDREPCSSALDSNISVPIWKWKSDTWKQMLLIIESIIFFSDRGCQERRSVYCNLWFGRWGWAAQDQVVFCERPAVLFLDSFRVEPSCVSVNLWCAILFIFSSIPVWLVFWSFSAFLFEYAVVMMCWRFYYLSFNKVLDFHFDLSFHFGLWKFLPGLWMCCPFSFFLLLIRLW